jgi:hypothetical protein
LEDLGEHGNRVGARGRDVKGMGRGE